MADGSSQQPQNFGVNPWLIAVSVMLATFMEVLDTAIASVALPYIAGSLSATNDEATWVLTSYLVANAMILPASNWFSLRFGRKRFLITCVIIFTIASFFCGAAPTLGFILIARIVQGAGGGALQPLSQSILLESFPPEKRGAAMALFAFGVVVAPVLGPTLGGWLTDTYSWRYAFYINIPVGALAVFMIGRYIKDPEYITKGHASKFDGLGFGLLTVWTGCLQVILDKGQEDDWFGATWIRWAFFVLIVSFTWFVVHSWRSKTPLVNLKTLKNWNFGLGCALIAMFGVCIYSMITVLPLFYQELLGYTAFTAGLVVGPRGIGSILGMPVIGYLGNKVDPRYLLTVGFVGFGVMSLYFGNLTLDISPWTLLVPIMRDGIRAELCVCADHDAGVQHAAERSDRKRERHFQFAAERGWLDRDFDCANAAGAAQRGTPDGDRRFRVADAVLVRAAAERLDGLSDTAYGGAERARRGGSNFVSATRATVAAVGVCGCFPMDILNVLRMRGAGLVLPQGSTGKTACWSALGAACSP